MTNRIPVESDLYFSYSQFFVYDSSIRSPGCLWTDAHVAQGFARRRCVVCFGTLLEFGSAKLCYIHGPYQANPKYERVVAVPFEVVTGRVMVDGPDELNVRRSFAVPPGHYELVAAQNVLDDEQEAIDLFIHAVEAPIAASRIIVADNELLAPPVPLIETVGRA